jgi:hypothetical protein
MNNQTSVQIPFSGTYYSIWSDLIDMEQEHHLEWVNEDYSPTEKEAGAYGDYLYIHTDYKAAYNGLAFKYAEHFADFVAEKIGAKVYTEGTTSTGHAFKRYSAKATYVAIGFEFEEMTSPREYNFTTDRIFCKFSLATMQAILALPEVVAMLPSMIKRQHSSRDGFHSHYSNDITMGEWVSPVEEWDHNQWHTVLLCLFPEEDSFREFEYSVYEELSGNNQFCNFPCFEKWREEEWLPTVTLDNAALKALEDQLESLLAVDVPRYVHEGYMTQLMDAPPPEELELSHLYTKSGQFETLHTPTIEA